MSWSINKTGMSDRVAAAAKRDLTDACGSDEKPGYLQEPEKTLCKMAMNLIDAALGEIKPPFFVQVQASGSMSRSGAQEKGDFKEIHTLEVKISPFWGYVE